MDYFLHIKGKISEQLDKGKKNFILFPYGQWGVLTKKILNDVFDIKENYIIDNQISKYNKNVKPLTFLKDIDTSHCTILITSDNKEIYKEIRDEVKRYVKEEVIVDLFENKETIEEDITTKCGKHRYGPLCKHWLVESVGAFCSFAPGTDVVQNHPIEYISTHPFLYYGSEKDNIHEHTYEYYHQNNPDAYVLGFIPKGEIHKSKRSIIGNDVWLGKNVIITNGACIGNGVIAAAGAVITKDVPDYAIVAGVPAKIVRYRYSSEQIKKLNDIAWWNWSDEKIVRFQDDFYIPVDDFIKKHEIE